MNKIELTELMNIDPESIANQARESISSYCIQECKAYCCRKGYLVLSEAETALLAGQKKQSYIDDKRLRVMKTGELSLNLDGGCPQLTKNFMCGVHKERHRPTTCKEFPVFVTGKHVRFSPRCPAVRDGKLYPYEREFVLAGLDISGK